jgi:hypothetical protein
LNIEEFDQTEACLDEKISAIINSMKLK